MTMSDETKRFVSQVSLVLLAVSQLGTAMMSFWDGRFGDGVGTCGMATILVLMCVGDDPGPRRPEAMFVHGWAHHRALVLAGLAVPVLLAAWLGSRAESWRDWVSVLQVPAAGILGMLAILFHRYRLRDREAVARPNEF